MSETHVTLQQLIDDLESDLAAASDVERVSEAQQRARALADMGDQLIDHFVARARVSGASWTHLGEALGVTKQAAQQRWLTPTFRLFTDRARSIVVLAQEHARTLRHEQTGTGHLLLAIIDEGDGAAAQVLTTLIGSLEPIRGSLASGLTPGTANPPARIPFTVHADEALTSATEAARELGQGYVGTEHLLLGLVTAGAGTAARVLTQHAVDEARARPAVRAWLNAYAIAHATVTPRTPSD